MPVHYPANADTARLLALLDRPDAGLVVCFCAAWCDACRGYQPRFEELSARYPDMLFVWADIEDHPELLGDEDVENFPTLLIRRGARTLFYGTMLPHIGHLQRMLENLDADGPEVRTALPDVAALLRQSAAQP